MPRTSETKEAQILTFFKTAPLPAAQMLLGLAVSEVKSRNGGLGPAAKPGPAYRRKLKDKVQVDERPEDGGRIGGTGEIASAAG